MLLKLSLQSTWLKCNCLRRIHISIVPQEKTFESRVRHTGKHGGGDCNATLLRVIKKSCGLEFSVETL